jgi:hypothetical protein
MAVNRYFNQTAFAPEQDLVQDLIDESIQIYGHDVHYIPRDTVNMDTFLGEDPLTAFTTTYPIEMYLKTLESFQGQSEFISKFGLHIEDQATFIVSRRRFNSAVVDAVDSADTVISRPREADLIYIEMTADNRYLFEIKFVEDKERLFQLGKLYTYELRCELMNFTNEKVNTNVDDIDEVAQREAYTINITMNAGGSGTFVVGESVYQGNTSLAAATASAEVYEWTASTRVLAVQRVVGTFAGSTAVKGNTSGAQWTSVAAAAATAPTLHDPLSDNAFLQGNPLSVVKSRGTHMLED